MEVSSYGVEGSSELAHGDAAVVVDVDGARELRGLGPRQEPQAVAKHVPKERNATAKDEGAHAQGRERKRDGLAEEME